MTSPDPQGRSLTTGHSSLSGPWDSSQGLNSMPFPLAWHTDMAQGLRMFLS